MSAISAKCAFNANLGILKPPTPLVTVYFPLRMPAYGFAVDLLPIYVLVHIAFLLANIWITSALLLKNSLFAVFEDVLFHGLFLLPIYLTSKMSIKPPTKGVFHCTMCHVGQEFTVWDFVALAVHCGFLAGALIERIFTRFELSITYFLMVIIRVFILFALVVYHFRKEMSELEQRANSRT